MSYLHSIQTVLPAFKLPQVEVSVYMQKWYNAKDELARKIQLMYGRSGIQYRHSCLSDFTGSDSNSFYSSSEFPGINKRMQKYFEVAPDLAHNAAADSIKNAGLSTSKITHLVTISCTGMAAPGLDLMLVESLGLPLDIARTSVNFMGCYAGFHALKMANQISLSNPDAHVLLVSVELCTLHFQKDYSIDQVAANLLFADGAAACIISSQKPISKSYLKINSFYSRLIPKGKSDMAWNISESGFLMTLSSYIPDLLSDGIGDILNSALRNIGLSKSEIIHWAIHPGGRKILDNVRLELGLKMEQMTPSYQTLANYGNMSSATIFFVLKDLMEVETYSANQKGFAAGFGPGLTVETMSFNL